MNSTRISAVLLLVGVSGLAIRGSKHEQINASEARAEIAPTESLSRVSQLPAAISPAPVSASPDAADLAQLAALNQILAAEDDNDPRLDRNFQNLSPRTKALMRERYSLIAPEKRNQLGTIVYLLGRELRSRDDVEFLHSVLNEPPCKSLINQGVDEVTLAYPQLVALKAIEAFLSQAENSELVPALLAELESARRAPIQKVASLAEKIMGQYRRPAEFRL